MTISRLLMLIVVFIVAAVSGCATTTSSPIATERSDVGFVSGVASPCQGPAGPQQDPAATKVQVQRIKNNRVVALDTVTGRHVYRFASPAGSYVVSSTQPATTPVAVVITAGQTRTVNLLSRCF